MGIDISKEELLIDIRNKLGDTAHLISLVEVYFGDEKLTDDKAENILGQIKSTIPKALELINYVKQYPPHNQKRDNSKDTHIFFE
tara:strand:- start:183 stop:437 length:255 start_codon:yes stop_codon:yes gene_type:complete